jgi:hypothetical protein
MMMMTGLIVAYFSLSGSTPEERDLLQVWGKGDVIKGHFILEFLWGFHHTDLNF